MTDDDRERLASQLAAIQYWAEAAGEDKRGILIALRRDERDLIVKALRAALEKKP